MSLFLTVKMVKKGARKAKFFIFLGPGLKKSLTSGKFKKKKSPQNAQKSIRNTFLDPRKGFYDVFDTFWTYFFFDHFWPFLLCFMVILRPWGTMKVTKNGVDELRKHVWDRFLGVFDHIRPSWSGFGSFWREIKFVIFWPFLLCFLVKRGPSWGRKSIKSHPKWLFFHSLDVFLMFLDLFRPLECVSEWF